MSGAAGALRIGGLELRPFDDGDAAAFATAVRESVDTVGRWMPWCHVGYTDDEALRWFALTHADRETGTAYEFGVFDARTSAFLGGAGLNLINRAHRVCNLGYWVRQSSQRQGVASRSVIALVEHAFGALELQRVEIVAAVGNDPSEGVARKAGARFECVARNRLMIGERSSDASVFSLVADRSLR